MFTKKLIVFTFLLILAVTAAACAAPPAEVREVEVTREVQVTVEVTPSVVNEALHVEIRKVSTGEVLAEADGKGILSLEGGIGTATLKDDRRIEAVVTPAQGSRGTRGTISASYPARAIYRRTE